MFKFKFEGLDNCKESIMESALSIKGQATIPNAIREYLHLEPGDRIKFFLIRTKPWSFFQDSNLGLEGYRS